MTKISGNMTPQETEAYWATLARPDLVAARVKVQRCYAEACRRGRTADAYGFSSFSGHRATSSLEASADRASEAYFEAYNDYHCRLRPEALAAVGLGHVAAAQPKRPLTLRKES